MSLEAPPQLSVGIGRTVRHVDDGAIGKAVHDRAAKTRRSPRVRAAGHVDLVVGADRGCVPGGLAATNVDIVPAASVLVQVNPAARTKARTQEIPRIRA